MSFAKQHLAKNEELYRRLFLSKTPMIDLRAPVEFNGGSFPASHNLPLMTDDERTQVGICYKEQGSDAAVLLGHKLVAHDIESRIQQWAEFKQLYPRAWLYCFRGGMRSQITVQMLKDHGIGIDIVPGGYKALRGYLLGVIGQISELPVTLIGGNTGCGKTLLLQTFVNGLDLERRANHRGSSFGQQLEGQPSQINFENWLAIDMLNITQSWRSLIIEDESRTVGRRNIPLPLFERMSQAPMVIIDDPFEIRLQRLQREYCSIMTRKYYDALGETLGWKAYHDYLHQGLYGIRKRLGSEKFGVLKEVLNQALLSQQNTGSMEAHLNWIAPILNDYYDPMYQYQIGKGAHRIQFVGCYSDVQQWLVDNQAQFKIEPTHDDT